MVHLSNGFLRKQWITTIIMEKDVFSRKTMVTILALSSSAVMAGTIGPVCKTDEITLPCEKTNWEFGAKALYFQAFSGNIAGSRTFSTSLVDSVSVGEGTRWGWGYAIEGAYHFNTGNDVNLNWYHLNYSSSINRLNSGAFRIGDIGLVGNIGLTDANGTITFDNISSTTNPIWDAVNLEFGQLSNYGKNRTFRLHGGLTFAHINAESTLNIIGTVVPSGGTPRSYLNAASASLSYNGLGPRVGGDLAYAWGNGLRIYLDGAAGLLAGASKFSNFQKDNGLTNNGTNTYVVPELEGKIGGTYSFFFARGDMNLNAGWMWINYIGAISVASSSVTQGPNVGNFSMQGPYLGFTWTGNIG